jgi:alpha-galactosidase
MDEQGGGIPVSVEAVGERHWRLVWGGNALEVRLTGGSLAHVDGPATLYTRLGPAGGEAAGADAVFAFPDALRRVDADIRIGARRQVVAWDAIAAAPRADGITLTLTSGTSPLRAEVSYSIDPSGVLVRDTVLAHAGGGAAVEVSGAPSFALALPEPLTEAVVLAGEWGHETQVQRLRPGQAPIYLESRAGKTGFEYSPWLALQGEGATIVAELMWSGNWHLAARRGPGATYLSGGLPEMGFSHRLEPGGRLVLPRAAFVREAGGLDAATHRLHDFRRAQRPDATRDVPVQFNSWYPHPGEPDLRAMLDFVPVAKRLNCEVFVLDAGWYTTETEDPAENWWTRTGDWVVNRRLFPNGLEELSRACQAAGLGFGIWFEPEAVSPSSVVRREHPDWLHHVDGVPPAADKRAILNLGVPAAREFVRDRIFAILEATEAVWMKWDFNTDLRQGGWAAGYGGDTGADPLVAHYEGLYRLQDEIRAAFPALTLEMCAGGGGRFDGAIMAHAHTNWMSDQKQPLRNLAIHFGSQLAHPPVACNDWLIEWPPDSIAGHLSRGAAPDARGGLGFRLMIPMLGTLGISAPVGDWSEDEIALAGRYVDWYRRHVRARVNGADQYLLTEAPPLDGNGDWAAIWYADKDKGGGAGFFFRLTGAPSRRFALAGLDPNRQYRVGFLDGPSRNYSGAELADGLDIALDDAFTAAAILVELI